MVSVDDPVLVVLEALVALEALEALVALEALEALGVLAIDLLTPATGFGRPPTTAGGVPTGATTRDGPTVTGTVTTTATLGDGDGSPPGLRSG